MYKKVNVVMLPTNEKVSSSILLGVVPNLAILTKDVLDDTYDWMKFGKPQHLYIISDEKIKKGDWFIANQGIFQCLEVVDGDYPYKVSNQYNNNEIQYQSKHWLGKKIIATTNKNLIIKYDERFEDVTINKNSLNQELPQPSQEFIQQYIEEYNKGNVITKVEVEYNPPYLNPEYNKESLKINSNNTINIKSIKESWNREEVIELLRESHCLKSISFIQNNSLDKWLEENL